MGDEVRPSAESVAHLDLLVEKFHEFARGHDVTICIFVEGRRSEVFPHVVVGAHSSEAGCCPTEFGRGATIAEAIEDACRELRLLPQSDGTPCAGVPGRRRTELR